MQRGLGGGANRELHFGRNEFACELFERGLAARLELPQAGEGAED